MVTGTTPLTIYYEGLAITGDSAYRYTTAYDTVLTGYRIISRTGALPRDLVISLKQNGTQVTTLTLPQNTIDSGDQLLAGNYYSTGDQLELTIQQTGDPGNTGSALTITLFTKLGDRTTSGLGVQQIQTPLIARFEGIIDPGTTIYKRTIQQPALFNRARVFARVPADQDILLSLHQNGVAIQTLTLPAGAIDSNNILISQTFSTNDLLELVVVQGGGLNYEGMSLLCTLDYSNTSQTTFTTYQIPFIVEQEGLAITNDTILKYNVPRSMTLKFGQILSRVAAEVPVTVAVSKNGSMISSMIIPAGGTQSTVSTLAISYVSGDELGLAIITPDQYAAGLTITLDYTITVTSAGTDFAAFVYYSDPNDDLVLLARQVGIGGAKADILNFQQLDKWKRDANNIIDNRLRSLYRVPLVKVAQAGTNNPWPNPIQHIAQRLVLRNMLSDVFGAAEPNNSDNAERNGILALEDLNALLRKEMILEGQRLRSRNFGSNPYTEPMAPLGGAAPAALPGGGGLG